MDEALASGLTTLIGGGTGPATGTKATTCTPGAWNMHRMLQAAEAFPMNLGFLGKGNAARPSRWRSRSRRGPAGSSFTRTGARRRPPSTLPDGRREIDVQVAIHTDTLNEAGFVEDTIAGLQGAHDPHLSHRGRGRRPRARHHQGGGDANVLPSSTNPTRPYTVNTMDEHLDMVLTVNGIVGFVEDGRQLGSPQTRMMSGAWPPPAPSV